MKVSRTAGFTLLELLIAMTLLGFMLALLFGGMRLGARSWDAGELRAENTAHTALVLGFLRRELSQIAPYRWRKKTATGIAFSGEPSRLRFIAPIAMRAEPGGLYQVSLEYAQEKDIGQWVMKRIILDSDSGDFSNLDNAEKVVLAEQVEKVTIAYFGAETKDAEPQWQDKWEDPQRIPYLIRIRLKFSNGQDWPELVVAPLISVDGSGIDPACMWVSGCVNGRRP